jgi:hypothetical protein
MRDNKAMTVRTMRRAEATVLLLLAIALAVTEYGKPLMALNFPVIGIALALAARNLGPSARTRPVEKDGEVWDDLALQGRLVHGLFDIVEETPASWERSRDLLLAKYQAQKWIDKVRKYLTSYPEFAAIFEAHGAGDSKAELEGRIRRLNEIRNLIELGQKLHLQPSSFRRGG